MLNNYCLYQFKKRFILYVFCCDYYCGQADYFYKLLCMIKTSLNKAGIETTGYQWDKAIKSARRYKLYKQLVEKYGKE